ncbi:hypothetical protein ACWPKO_16830 [Coraliomargarita sp. W4R53]
MKKIKTLLPLALTICSASSVIAVNVEFEGGGASQNWSDDANWSSGAQPGASDTLYFEAPATLSMPSVADVDFETSGDIYVRSFNATAASGVGNAFGNAYVEVASGVTLRSRYLQVGSANAAYGGVLTLKSGSAIVSDNLRNGYVQLQRNVADNPQYDGHLIVEDGVSFNHRLLSMQVGTELTFQFGSNSVSTFTYQSTNDGFDNVLDGLLRLDLTNLNEAGTYALIQDNGLTTAGITGALFNALKSSSITGTGDYTSSNFEIISGAGVEWELRLADSDKDIEFVVSAIPEPTSYALLLGCGGLVWCLSRRQAIY